LKITQFKLIKLNIKNDKIFTIYKINKIRLNIFETINNMIFDII